MQRKLKAKQKVKIVKDTDKNDESDDHIYWNPAMDKYDGKTTTIRKLDGDTYKLDIDKGKWAWSSYWLIPYNHNYQKPKYAVGTSHNLIPCGNIEELKDNMSLKLSEEKSKNIIGFKLVPIYRVRSLKRDVKFTKCSSGRIRHTSDLVK